MGLRVGGGASRESWYVGKLGDTRYNIDPMT